MPALERYDGPLFRVVRKFIRECPEQARRLNLYVLSAEFGLIYSHKRVPGYDRRMTPQRAIALNPQVLTTLKRILKEESHDEMFISAGKDYFVALNGFQSILPASLKVVISNGARGRRQAELRDWLRGPPPCSPPIVLPAAQQRAARLRGVQLRLSTAEAIDRLRGALQEANGSEKNYQSWYIEIDGRCVALKWAASRLTDLPVGAFGTDEARRVLAQLGIKINRV